MKQSANDTAELRSRRIKTNDYLLCLKKDQGQGVHCLIYGHTTDQCPELMTLFFFLYFCFPFSSSLISLWSFSSFFAACFLQTLISLIYVTISPQFKELSLLLYFLLSVGEHSGHTSGQSTSGTKSPSFPCQPLWLCRLVYQAHLITQIILFP